MNGPSGPAVVFGTGGVAVAVLASRLASAGVPVTLVSHSPRASERLQHGVHVVSGDTDGVEHRIVRPERVLCMDDVGSVGRAVVTASLLVVATSAGDDVALASTLRAALGRRSTPTTVLVCTNSPHGAGRLGRLVVGTDIPVAPAGLTFAGVLVDQIVTNVRGSRGAPTLRSERARPLLVECPTGESFPVPLPDSTGTAHFTEALAAKLCSFSLGHAATAYLGAVRGHRRIDTALATPR
ncbi:hypothetical protein GCM10023258_23920 [Terrabacter aeriphilus]|uniref:Ketopantoate reductase N-terminal domain-containing protein n=1 Tax=Terrabacter aeriphilus TaxID=515662 RepID=A0ABP9JG18_9MICO